MTPLKASIHPWPPFFQQWKVASPRLNSPVQKNQLAGVMAPFSSAASSTTILKIDPGENCPLTALLISGALELVVNARHCSVLSPLLKSLGSKPGVEVSARTSPLWMSMTTTAPPSPLNRRLANFCSSRSMVNATSAPA